MAGERLSSSEKRALLLWIVAAVFGTLFAFKYYLQSSPEASVNLQISRVEGQTRAQQFIGALGENVAGYRSSIVFDVDDNAKTYLERELGLKAANQLFESTLKIWSWDVRFFRPGQQEEFHVYLNGAGEVVGYEHEVEEAHAGASLDRAAAEALAERFAATNLHQDLAGWELLPEEANSTKRPNRTDWSFAWEKRGFRAKDAPYRLTVSVEGEHIGGAKQYLKVPEDWQRGFARLRSGNDTLTLVFLVPYLVVLVLAVWLGIRLNLRGQATWRIAIVFGLFVTFVLFLQNLNGWPLWSSTYDTNTSYESFIALKIAGAIGLAVVTALTITLVLPAGEVLYRGSQPNQLQLYKIFSLRGLRSKEFFSATVVGLSMAAVHIAYVTAFYIVAKKLGSWAPQDLKYEESVNTLFPWISGAAIGLLASTNEEFTFRLFAIPFLKRLTGSRWLAVIVPAFLWSFLHSNYPQEPAYIRGIEIGLFGIVAGLVMLRWGILATLIWHYTVDALLVGLFLIRSNSLYFKISGLTVAAAAIAPLLFAGVSYLARGRFEPVDDLLNSAKPVDGDMFQSPTRTGEAQQIRHGYRALTPALLGLLMICLVAGGLIVWRVKVPAIGDYLQLSVDARSVKAQADTVMRQHGVKPEAFHGVAIFLDNTDSGVNEYLRQRIGIAALNDLYAKRVPGALWKVRYFQDSQPEEFAIVLRPDGTLHSFRHSMAEAAAGASLTKDEAVARAEKFLHDEEKIDLTQWSLVDSDSTKRPHRLDHTLTWQENAALDATTNRVSGATDATDSTDQAHVRIEVQVLGDEVANYRTYVKIPEAWTRDNQKITLSRILLGYGIKGFVFLGLGLSALIAFLRNLRSEEARKIPWRRLMLWGGCGFLAYAAVFALGANRLPNSYVTAIPYKIFIATLGIGSLIGGAFYFGGMVLCFGVAYYFALRAFGEQQLPGWSGMPAAYYRDALLIGLGGAAALIGLQRAVHATTAHWPAVHRSSGAAFGTDFDTLLPGFHALAGAILSGLLITGVVSVLGTYVAAVVKPMWLRLLLFLGGAAALVSPNWGNGADFSRQFVVKAILLAFIVLGMRWLLRLNLLGCFLVLTIMSIAGGLGDLLGQPDQFYRANGYVLLAGLVVLLAWPVFVWRRASLQAQSAG